MNTDYGWISAGSVNPLKSVEVDPRISGFILTELGIAVDLEGCPAIGIQLTCLFSCFLSID